MDEIFGRLADALGIARTWYDINGHEQELALSGLQALAEALGHPAATADEASRSLEALLAFRSGRRLNDHFIIPEAVPVELPLAADESWQLLALDREPATLAGRGPAVAPGGLAPGRYRLRLDALPDDPGTLLLIRPSVGPLERWAKAGRRAWGVMAALYGLRSSRNAGLGDYDDLGTLAGACGAAGADFLGINPVHALRTNDGGWFSPYSPSHRGFWNTAHIALDRLPELAFTGNALTLLRDAADVLAELRASERVDYAARAVVVAPILEAAFDAFSALPSSAPRRLAFQAFRTSAGSALEDFACFEALADEYGPIVAEWPPGYAHSGDSGVAAFVAANERRITFHAWLQFVAEEQLGTAAAKGRAAGLTLGFYFDIAVGTVRGAAEVWSRRDAFATGVSLGAPPDHFNPVGQAWDLAPIHPHRLLDSDGEPFVGVLRAAMRHAGVVRIDHVLGLRRAFWVPADGRPGGYVSYPFDALLAMVAIEAHRADTVVVGEDLGLVPEGLRERLAQEHIAGYTVLQFERHADGFVDPGYYRHLSIASIGSHDVPPLRGWWAGSDIVALRVAGMVDDAEAQAMREERGRARVQLWELLARRGLLADAALDPGSPPAALDTVALRACHRLLAESPAILAAVQLDDVLGVVEQQNLPGTVNEHPNWRRRHPVDIEALASEPEWQATAALFRAARGTREQHLQEEAE